MTDIAELFARDPMELSKDDITAIVQEFRKNRGQYNLGAKSAGSTKPKTEKQKKDLADIANINLSLDDL
jgi:hypothetical protein